MIKTNVQNLPHHQIFLKVEEAVQQFFKENHYQKLDLPVLSTALLPESYLEIFATKYSFLDTSKNFYLTPSPELFIKRLLCAGLGDCYYLGKAFRNNEPSSSFHSLEFTILEFYKIGQNYSYLEKEIQRLLLFICQSLFQSGQLEYQGKKIDLKRPWEEISVTQSFEQFAEIKSKELFDHKKFKIRAQEKGYKITKKSFVELFSQIYTQEIEPNLGQRGRPTIIYDYPKEMAALAKLNSDGKTCQRFEFYIAGVELGDCYTELTDWKKHKERFKKEFLLSKKSGKIKHKIDWGFVKKLQKLGLPECSGIAIGVDRLAMLFANVSEISKLRLINIL